MRREIADLARTIKVCESSIDRMQDAIDRKDFSGYRYCTTELLANYMVEQYRKTIANCNGLIAKLTSPEDLA